MKKIFIFSLLLCCVMTYAADMEVFFRDNRQHLWSMSPAVLEKKLGCKLSWTDSSRQTMQYTAPSRSKSRLSLYGIKLREAKFSFASGRLSAVYMSAYNRGDDGDWDLRTFKSKRLMLQNKIPGDNGNPRTLKDRTYLGGVPCNIRYWETPSGTWYVKWSENKYEPEYLTVLFNAPGTKSESLRQSVRAEVNAKTAAGKVKTDNRGYCYLDVPMVDQGKKGYCAAATVSRIMQFYGADVDQHVIAQLAETDAAGGTAVENIFDALDKAETSLRVHIDKLYTMKYFDSFDSTCKFIDKYNRTARKLDKKRLKESSFITKKGNTKIINSGMVWHEALKQQDVYKAFRLEDTSGRRNFEKDIVEYIGKGVPLVWMIPGHMRIITGYNADRGEIVFSDSWGQKHERKIMKTDDAWVITTHLFVMRPRGIL